MDEKQEELTIGTLSQVDKKSSNRPVLKNVGYDLEPQIIKFAELVQEAEAQKDPMGFMMWSHLMVEYFRTYKKLTGRGVIKTSKLRISYYGIRHKKGEHCAIKSVGR